MAFNVPSRTYKAGGDINPSRFVKKGSGDFQVIESTADDITEGISQEGARDAPIPSASTLAAASGDPVKVYVAGAECWLDLGGTVSAFDELVSDANGKGVALTAAGTSRENIGAIAQEGGASGDRIRVVVVREAVTGAIAAS